AGAVELDQAGGRHLRDGLVAGRKDAEPGDVAAAAVGETADDRELLPASRGDELASAGEDLDLRESGKVGRVVLQALGEPLRERLCAGAAGREASASFVRHAAESLEEEQTVGADTSGPSTELVAGELEEVGIRIVAAERELEAVLAVRRPVAGAAVAAADVEG